MMDFENDGGGLGELLECQGSGGPIDGSVSGPKMFVFLAAVVVDVDGGNAAPEGGEGRLYADCDVGMAEVETDADRVEMSQVKNFEEVFGKGRFADEVFDEETNAEGTGKGAEVFQGGLGMLDRAERPAIVALTEVHDEVSEMDGFGGLEGALDFVHGGDAASFFGVQDVDGGSAGATHFAIREEGGVHGPWLEGVGSEPGSQLSDMVAVSVVKMLTGGEDLDGLGA